MCWCLLEVFLKFLKASIFMNVLEIRHWTMDLLPSRGSFVLTLVLFLSALSSEISSSFSKSCSLQAFNSFVRAANSWKGNKNNFWRHTPDFLKMYSSRKEKKSKYKLLNVKNRKKNGLVDYTLLLCIHTLLSLNQPHSNIEQMLVHDT